MQPGTPQTQGKSIITQPMKKQNRVATISINIFDIPSDFKPCVKRTDLSTRNSNLFTENQSSEHWRSTSKKVG